MLVLWNGLWVVGNVVKYTGLAQGVLQMKHCNGKVWNTWLNMGGAGWGYILTILRKLPNVRMLSLSCKRWQKLDKTDYAINVKDIKKVYIF